MLEQKEVNSINILMTTIARDEANLSLHIAKVFGNHNLIQNQSLKDRFEDELEKVKILEYFPKDDITLEGAKFITWEIGKEKKLSPDISLIKHYFNNNIEYLVRQCMTFVCEIHVT